MKIIGGHDYYDGAGWGVDDTCVFIRKKCAKISDVEYVTDHPFKHMTRIEFGSRSRGERGHLQPFLVVLAGEIYPGLREVIWANHMDPYQLHDRVRTTYDLEEALGIFDAHVGSYHGISFLQNELIAGKQRRERLREHFSRKLTPEQTDWILENRVTILNPDRDPDSRSRPHVAQVDHACLKDLEFFKCLDPATTHMRIANFISGVLPSSRETIDLSNKDRIRKAGFDTVTSFRKGPET